MSNNARFVAWLRGAIPQGNALAVSAGGHTVSVPMSRYGPGDVIGVAASLIRTRQPAPDSVGAPPNLFPYIEFSQADLPWCMTPVDPDAHGQLAPWLALVVLEAPSDDVVGNAAGGKLPVIQSQGSALPPASEVGQWAHVQIASAGTQNEDLLRQGTARILSPRALAPSTRYVACLVPVFEAGRLAGLGQTPPDRMSTAMAWSDTTGSLQMPVYSHWFFTTGPAEDFETLARRLRGRDISSTSQPLALNVSAVAGDAAGNIAPLEGALRPVGSEAPWTGPAVAASSAKLSGWMAKEAVSGTPLVGPPIYGSIQSGKTKIAAGWMADLNLDPRRRGAAGLGAHLVRAHQDELIDEAWRQVGDLPRARREFAGAQLGDIAKGSLHARFVAPLTAAHALVTFAPAAPVMKDAAVRTLAARVRASTLPAAALSAPFRRTLAVKTSPEARRAGNSIARTLPIQNARSVVPGAQPPTPARLATDAQIRRASVPITAGGGGVGGVHITPALNKSMLGHLTPDQLKILTDAAPQLDARQPAVIQVPTPKPLTWIAPPAPAVTASMRLNRRVQMGDAARMRSNWTIVSTPRFRQPLAEWLDNAFLMAGVQIPPDTAGLLEVNSTFVEAVIVGANHELSRELLWRGVPLDRSATLMGYFFESQSSAPPKECPPISTWKDSEKLGSHVSSGEKAVVVLRTRLVGHMSEALIYLTPAQMQGAFRVPSTDPNAKQLLPVFRGIAGVDTAYLGFEIAPEAMAGSQTDPGWYLVIQEREGAPRFGFHELPEPALTTYNDVAWPQVSLTTGGNYVSLAATKVTPSNPGAFAWGGGAANMAAICLQKPVRVSIHGSLLEPPKKS